MPNIHAYLAALLLHPFSQRAMRSNIVINNATIIVITEVVKPKLTASVGNWINALVAQITAFFLTK